MINVSVTIVNVSTSGVFNLATVDILSHLAIHNLPTFINACIHTSVHTSTQYMQSSHIWVSFRENEKWL